MRDSRQMLIYDIAQFPEGLFHKGYEEFVHIYSKMDMVFYDSTLVPAGTPAPQVINVPFGTKMEFLDTSQPGVRQELKKVQDEIKRAERVRITTENTSIGTNTEA